LTTELSWKSANSAKRHQCPVFVIAGSVEDDVGLMKAQGIDAVYGVVSDDITLEEALTEPSKHLTSVSRQVARVWQQELGG